MTDKLEKAITHTKTTFVKPKRTINVKKENKQSKILNLFDALIENANWTKQKIYYYFDFSEMLYRNLKDGSLKSCKMEKVIRAIDLLKADGDLLTIEFILEMLFDLNVKITTGE